MKCQRVQFLLLIFLFTGFFSTANSQEHKITAEEVIRKMDEKSRGLSSYAEMTMTIQRPTWSRAMSMKIWSKGEQLALIYITSPARDEGTANLKRDQELWNWQPSIDRVVKLPPSMMLKSWMSSDFTNDDLVKESSLVHDYSQTITGDSLIEGYTCYKIELDPKEEASVVWGKIITWVAKADYIQLLTKFYDEDGYLINVMRGKDIKELGGRKLPSIFEMIPVEKEGYKTIVTYNHLEFDIDIEEEHFSIQNIKNVR